MVYSLSKILFSSTFEEQLDLASLYETDGADVAVLTVASAVEKAVLEPNSCHETFNPYNRFGQTITYSSFKFIFPMTDQEWGAILHGLSADTSRRQVERNSLKLLT